MINGGADRISQMTAQMVVDGLLEVALVKDDLDFFREIAKPSLVLFLVLTNIYLENIYSSSSIHNGLTNSVVFLQN